MLHRLFHGHQHRPSTEADQKSHALLHGSRSETSVNLGGHDVRLIIAQDLGEKAKVVLFDTASSSSSTPTSAASQHKISSLESTSPRKPMATQGSRRAQPAPISARPSTHNHAELITELMFGTVPLSYRGTSVRVHPLTTPNSEDGKRSFLFTKVFTVNATSSSTGSASPATTTASGSESLASSYGSVSAMREYPFPSMTPIDDGAAASRGGLARDASSRDRGQSLTRGMRNPPNMKQHIKQMSGGGLCIRRDTSDARSDFRDAAPHVPFTKNESNSEHFSGWLPSPGPVLSRRRRSIDTNASTSPGGSVSNARYQPAMCAIGVIFSVPGTGHEDTECALLTRYWQMITRATYALQRVVFDELELNLNVITAHGTIQTPRSRARPSKGEPQVYQRGRKSYVALGQGCLSSVHRVNAAVDVFRARLVGGINLPEIIRTPLPIEADILIEELSWAMEALDRKETQFLFSTLMSHLADFVVNLRRERVESRSSHKTDLRNRLVIVSDNVVLARRLIFCIARLFFRDHNDHLESAVDYALVWPSSGLLAVPKRDLLRQRQSTLAKATRLNHGWDIPGHTRPLSSGSYYMPPISPSIYHRPPSTTSNGSSRASSWKPSWSWFANGSRTHLAADECNRSLRSDSKTLQTSWDSSDFGDLVKLPGRKLSRAWSPDRETVAGAKSPGSPAQSSEEVATDDDEEATESIETAQPGDYLGARKTEDGSVEVELLNTISLFPVDDNSQPPPIDEAQSGFPLTGVLSRFHPDMLLQAIPRDAYSDSQLKDFLAEEDLYLHGAFSADEDAWVQMASITIAEVGNAWRVRKMTRLTRTLASAPTNACDESPKQPEWFIDDPTTSHLYEETFLDEVVTNINEDLIAAISETIGSYKANPSTTCIQSLIDRLPSFATPV